MSHLIWNTNKFFFALTYNINLEKRDKNCINK